MGCLIGMPKKRIVVAHKLKNSRKTKKTRQSQKNKIKQKRAELEKFLKTQNQSSKWFKGKKIKFNPKPFSRPSKNSINFHLDAVKKIDDLLEDFEKETKEQNKEKTIDSSCKLIEIREPLKRKTMPPLETEPDFIPEINDEDPFPTRPHRGSTSEFRFVKKIRESPDIVFIKKDFGERIKDEDFHTRMIGGKDIESQKHATGFAHIKLRIKDERLKQEKKTQTDEKTKTMTNRENNGVTKTKKELEETKEEIQEKKKELELAKKEAKEKEKELVEKMIEKEKKKKEDEKLKKIDMKKAKIATKEKERELKKKAKLEEKQKKLEAKMALKEEKLKQKKLKERQKHKESSDLLKTKSKEDKEPKEMHHFILGKKETIEINPLLDDDVRKVLIITDGLLEKLPDEIIDDFVKSKDFELYEKVINKYKIK